jgi:hypothetical protein
VIYGKSGFEVEDDEIQFGSSICENFSLVPRTLEKLQNYGHNPRFWTELKMNYGQNSSIFVNL